MVSDTVRAPVLPSCHLLQHPSVLQEFEPMYNVFSVILPDVMHSQVRTRYMEGRCSQMESLHM